jgi:hypothetical protein|tara:strand:- start:77 stop:442 length:366 start_codon:yes stop_codon:yes gene_type:complete
MKRLLYNLNKSISIIWFIPFIFLLFDCAAPVDYFGNSVNIKDDRIYLIKMRKDRNDKDKYTLIFVEQRGNHSKLTNKKREKTLDQYIDLIKSYYGYTSHNIASERERGVISPRFYVNVKFD